MADPFLHSMLLGLPPRTSGSRWVRHGVAVTQGRRPAGAGRTIARVRARKRSALANAKRMREASAQGITLRDAKALGLNDLLAKDEAVRQIAEHQHGGLLSRLEALREAAEAAQIVLPHGASSTPQTTGSAPSLPGSPEPAQTARRSVRAPCRDLDALRAAREIPIAAPQLPRARLRSLRHVWLPVLVALARFPWLPLSWSEWLRNHKPTTARGDRP